MRLKNMSEIEFVKCLHFSCLEEEKLFPSCLMLLTLLQCKKLKAYTKACNYLLHYALLWYWEIVKIDGADQFPEYK